MPRFAATDRRAAYDLVCFDSGGDERPDDPSGRMSDLVLRTLAAADAGVTDVFLLSHGWMGDVPAARAQYDKWVEAMTACAADLARMKQARPGFKLHVAGIHWPSLPWGDESFGDGGSFAVAVDGVPVADPVQAMVDDYAARIADTPEARDALRRIVVGAMENVEPDAVPPDVVAAYRLLNQEAEFHQPVPPGPPLVRLEQFAAGVRRDPHAGHRLHPRLDPLPVVGQRPRHLPQPGRAVPVPGQRVLAVRAERRVAHPEFVHQRRAQRPVERSQIRAVRSKLAVMIISSVGSAATPHTCAPWTSGIGTASLPLWSHTCPVL